MIVTYFGWFCIAMTSLALACGAIVLLLYWYDKAMERFERHVKRSVYTDLGQSLLASSHWFSEHKPAWMLLRVLGERLRDGYSARDADQVRLEWRRRCKEAGSPLSERG